MHLLPPPNQPSIQPSSPHRGAANIARSRLSGGSVLISARPGKCFSRYGQSSFHWILFDVGPDSVESRIGPNKMIITFLLPKWSMHSQQSVGLVSSETLQSSQPFSGRHARCGEKMNMIGHHYECVKLVPVQHAVAVPQRRHHHRRDLRPPQKQRTVRACIQKPVDSYERLARLDESGWRKHAVAGKTAVQPERHKQRLLNDVPMWQSAFIVRHILSWCIEGGEILSWPRAGRLKAGCGQYCPPHGAL